MMKKFLIILFLLVVGCNQKTQKNTLSLPNIVLIVADDLGYPYTGFMGDTIVQTPNLDKLANMGTVFTNGMVTQSFCAPSLRTIITGLHSETYNLRAEQLRQQFRDSLTRGLSAEDSIIWEKEFQWKSMPFFNTLPKYLAEKGYKSFQGGKWWEFNYQNGGFTHGMTKGWTREDRASPDFFYKLMGNEGLDLGRVTNQPVYDFIEKDAGDNPFFIWYAPDLPHYPLNAADEYYNIYKNQKLSESAKRYYANITWFDDEVGELMDYFEEKNLMEETLFIYVNDNGWEQGPQIEYRHDSLRWHNGGPKGKGSYYDMTFRTPILFTWKETLPHAQVKNELISSMDLLPTILDYLEIQNPKELLGNSLRPNIAKHRDTGHEKVFGRIVQLFDSTDKSFMGQPANGYWMRTEKYHYVWDIGNKGELLFDMENDPENDRNIATTNQKLTAEFKQDILQWKERIGTQN